MYSSIKSEVDFLFAPMSNSSISCLKRSISWISLPNTLIAFTADPISFFAHRIYGHYSPEGYSEISKVIVKKINDMIRDK